MNKKNKIIFSVIAIAVAVGLFYGGLKYGEARGTGGGLNRNGQAAGAGGAFGGRGGGANGPRGGANGGLVTGQILNKDNQNITVSIQGGGSRIVFLSASTSVMKVVSGTLYDLQGGTVVTVIGSANPDGSISAQSIQIRPAGFFGPRASSTTGQ